MKALSGLRPPALGWLLLLAGFFLGVGSLAGVWVVARLPIVALRATVDSLDHACLRMHDGGSRP